MRHRWMGWALKIFIALFFLCSECVYAGGAAPPAQSSKREWIFPKNEISAGYYNHGFFNPHIWRPPSPIFWHACKSVRSGVMAMYQRLIFHSRKRFSLYLGGSVSRWERFEATIWAPSIFFALRYWFVRTPTFNMYLSYSVAGPTVLNIHQLAEKNLGGNFIFQDYLGIGMQIGRRHALNFDLRLVHYSNGDVLTHNPGFDVPVVLYVGYSF